MKRSRETSIRTVGNWINPHVLEGLCVKTSTLRGRILGSF